MQQTFSLFSLKLDLVRMHALILCIHTFLNKYFATKCSFLKGSEFGGEIF